MYVCGVYYGVATISRLLKIIGFICNRTLQKSLYSATETHDFKEPTTRSQPILGVCYVCVCLCIYRYAHMNLTYVCIFTWIFICMRECQCMYM